MMRKIRIVMLLFTVQLVSTSFIKAIELDQFILISSTDTLNEHYIAKYPVTNADYEIISL